MSRCLQVGRLLACLTCMQLGPAEAEELFTRYPNHMEPHMAVSAPLKRSIRAAMLANLRQVAASGAAKSVAAGTMLAEADMTAVRAAVLGSIPGIAAGTSWITSSCQACPGLLTGRMQTDPTSEGL